MGHLSIEKEPDGKLYLTGVYIENVSFSVLCSVHEHFSPIIDGQTEVNVRGDKKYPFLDLSIKDIDYFARWVTDLSWKNGDNYINLHVIGESKKDSIDITQSAFEALSEKKGLIFKRRPKLLNQVTSRISNKSIDCRISISYFDKKESRIISLETNL